MKIGEAFPGEFLRKEDGGWPRKFTISHIEREMKVGDDIKPVVFFTGEERGLVLNKTTSGQITEICGSDETDDWTFREVVVYVDPDVMFGGKKVGGLRVRAPKLQQAAKPVQKPAPARSIEAEMDDDIPFIYEWR
jgi:hypothetical protein